MHRHWFFKLLAFVVAIAAGAALTLGALGMLLTGELDGYGRLYDNATHSRLNNAIQYAADRLAEQTNFAESGLSLDTYNRFFGDAEHDYEPDFHFHYRVFGPDGALVQGTMLEGLEYVYDFTTDYSVPRGNVVLMPSQAYYPPFDEEYAPGMTLPVMDETPAATSDAAAETTPVETPEAPTDAVAELPTEPVQIPAVSDEVVDYDYYLVPEGAPTSLADIDPEGVGTRYYRWLDASEVDGGTVYRIEYLEPRLYTVQIALTQHQMDTFQSTDASADTLGQFLTAHQDAYPTMVITGSIGLILAVLWLCLTAARKPGSDELKPDGLNRLPLDVYLAAAVSGIAVSVAVCGQWAADMVYRSAYGYYEEMLEIIVDIVPHGLLGALCGLIIAMFAMACAAQMKVGDNFWARNTLIGWGIRMVRLAGWGTLKGSWKLIKAGCTGCVRFAARCCRAMGRLHRMLPLVWQWLLASAVMWLLLFLGFVCAVNWYNGIFPLLFAVVVIVLVIVYGSYCFGKLRSAAQNMARGNLESKIRDQLMLGCFRDFADDLNALGDTCVEAAKKQMKSERMKSELITNVSHDIKTPLTSIINYVDLLQKAETEEQKKEYLEVLDRQSQRLKKLIEDLMEMSKASSGNVAAEIVPTDVGEAVNQALGEYADALERSGLTVVTRLPREPLMALCDGKLLWRVLNNVLSNTVKYALPGTRVYVDAVKRDSLVELSVKNISAKMLNITADELMERFVRGDESRNTEGNGLGLNIAKSLMELQGGTLELMVDGDLFKVVLTLRGEG